eukprot:6173890-Pleurochrysis_carterae.AAC.3
MMTDLATFTYRQRRRFFLDQLRCASYVRGIAFLTILVHLKAPSASSTKAYARQRRVQPSSPLDDLLPACSSIVACGGQTNILGH